MKVMISVVKDVYSDSYLLIMEIFDGNNFRNYYRNFLNSYSL